jgi:23S rRNA pseudouridine955/2504/2580 synthase
MHRFIVDERLRGIRLEDFLERQCPGADRRFLRGAMRDRLILVNRAPSHAQQRLAAGDAVELALDPADIPRHRSDAVAADLTVLHEDDELLVIDKPAGVHTLPDRGGKYRGVYGTLLDLRPGADLRIAHRLDQPTSGCLALAKGLAAAQHLDRAFREHRVHKEYLALVEGVPAGERFEVNKPLGPDRRRPGRMAVVDARARGARPAHTVVTCEERFQSHALVRVVPRTGRTHQIRVHLRAKGHPIVGDPDYGSGAPLLLSQLKPHFKQRRGIDEKPLLARMFLHAEILELPTLAGGTVRVRAPLPAELEMVLTKLRRYAAAGGGACG